MRHRKSEVKLSKTGAHTKAMFRNMVTSLFQYEEIKTTTVKAKILKGWADKIIGLAKKGDLASRRKALGILREKNLVHKLFEEAPTRFKSMNSGYTRVFKLGLRKGDAAPISLVRLFDKKEGVVKPKKAEKYLEKSEIKAEAPKTETKEETKQEA